MGMEGWRVEETEHLRQRISHQGGEHESRAKEHGEDSEDREHLGDFLDDEATRVQSRSRRVSG